MKNTIKVKTPAKINLTLEILGKREDGYHEIQSIMQAVSLYDYITLQIEEFQEIKIEISGNNSLIPYDKTNLAYISAELFIKKANISNKKINIYIEKNIPVAAGLAGGSSNAAGVLYGLNKLFNDVLNTDEMSAVASKIGADVNFCLNGGTQLATSRGEKLEKLKTAYLPIVIVKPKNLFISAKEAYEKYSQLESKPQPQAPEPMLRAISENSPDKIALLLNNALEEPILKDYPEILQIKNYLIQKGCINALMSGSGPSVFGIYFKPLDLVDLDQNHDIFYVESIETGIIET